MIALMVQKNPASDLKMKIYNESLSRGKIYIGKKYILGKKGQPCHTNCKNQKTRNWLVKRRKTPLGLLSYNA